MIENRTLNTLVQRATEQEPQTPANNPTQAPTDASEQFQQALAQDAEATENTAAKPIDTVATNPTSVGPVQPASHPGDAILQGMQTMRDNYQQSLNQVQQIAQTDAPLSPQELLRVQSQIAQTTLQQDLASKVVSKTTQGLETLLKSQ